jgi:hypothetical protein
MQGKPGGCEPPGEFGNSLGGRLQAVQIIDGIARVRSGGEDGPLVIVQDFEPLVDVACVVLADFRRNVEGRRCRSATGAICLGLSSRVGVVLARQVFECRWL